MTTKTIEVDQFIAAPPAQVWRAITEPELFEKWWVAGDVAPIEGHKFTLDMPGWGSVPCTVLKVEPEALFSCTFAEGSLDSTLTWKLVPEGRGTRLLFEHAGFDLDEPMHKNAFENMGPGWRDEVIPALAKVAENV